MLRLKSLKGSTTKTSVGEVTTTFYLLCQRNNTVFPVSGFNTGFRPGSDQVQKGSADKVTRFSVGSLQVRNTDFVAFFYIQEKNEYTKAPFTTCFF